MQLGYMNKENIPFIFTCAIFPFSLMELGYKKGQDTLYFFLYYFYVE